jgi:hypothetical protein
MTRPLLIATLLACAGLAVLSGCHRGADLSFRGSPRPTVLRRERVAGIFRLSRPLSAEPGEAFYIEYQGAAGGRTLRLLDPDGDILGERPLIDAGTTGVRLLLALPAGRPLARISVAPPLDGEVTLRAVGFTAAQQGFAAAAGLPAVGPGIIGWHRDGPAWEIQLADPAAVPAAPQGSPTDRGERGSGSERDGGAAAGQRQPAWRLELVLECQGPPAWARFRAAEAMADSGGIAGGSEGTPGPAALYRGPERAAAVLSVSDGTRTRRFLLTTLPGVRALYLYPAVLPLLPRSVRIEPLAGGRLWVQRLSLVPGAASPAGEGGGGEEIRGPLEPLPADPGVVLLYDPGRWRAPSYELFAWSRFPGILIMDTADYATQARFFKRLAFFVEKRGYRGRLATDGEIAGRHGFNAHDYRAEDLARFFQRASEEGFPLLPEELKLRSILLANGVLHLRDGAYAPGTGAVISISRSSYPLLRRHLLTHEALHGVFFAVPEYRQSAIRLWDGLGDAERAFWLLFFRWVGYDTADPYLAANELQAYLFQQERRGVGPYFRGVTVDRLLASYPDRRADILGFLGADPQAFERRFDELELRLIETAGLEGGRVIELTDLPQR